MKSHSIFHRISLATAIVISVAASGHGERIPSADETCDDCRFRFALKTNLLHDAAITPDIGAEISIAKRFSLSAEGVWARWGGDTSEWCWHIWGGWLEARYWPSSRTRAMTGHHFGIYGSMHEYDFSFGKNGCQSDGWNYGVGASYGYSVALGSRLNLDFSVRVGYQSGSFEKYRFICGQPVWEKTSTRRFFGPTGAEITLVWFPGWDYRNRPSY